MRGKCPLIGLLFSNPLDRALLLQFLQEMGYGVKAPEPGEFQTVEWKKMSLVITDEANAQLHEKGLINLKEQSEGIFLPLIVALRHGETAALWLRKGFDDVIRLPITKAELAARLRVFLRLREQSEELARRSEEMFRALVEQSLVGAYLIAEGQFIYANEALGNIFGYETEDLTENVDPLQLVHEEDRPIVSQKLRQMLQGEVGSLRFAFRGMGRERNLLHVEVFWRRISYKGENTIIGTLVDITERRKAEEALQQSLERTRKALKGTVQSMTMVVETRDPYTSGHQRRVAKLACAIAKEMELEEERVEAIEMAGLIHDIGKIAVPADILNKPSKLSEPEMALIRAHVEVSYQILKSIDFPWPVAEIVLQHHERMDGSGYPQGLRGDEILLEARILAVADAVEAMASHRPYRPARGIEGALEEISKNSGILYDPEAVTACLKLINEKGLKIE